ncbi:MAG: DUF2505 domain-containing protein [Ruaniaceae bacterium]|nr:DUF2505 domain-containing protein [Ruaniaceae bacterium]
MKFTTVATYPADAETIRALLIDPEFTKYRLAKAGVEASSIEASEDGNGQRLTIVVPISSDMVPANYRRFVPGSLSATITELWHPVAGDRSPTGVMSAEFSGVPASARADFRLTDTGEACERSFEGEVKVSIPLVGRAVEQKAVGMLESLVAAEARAAASFLAR